jgi:hypothetical protein
MHTGGGRTAAVGVNAPAPCTALGDVARTLAARNKSIVSELSCAYSRA